MTQQTISGYKVKFSQRDAATAEARAKSEDHYLRVLNSYVQAMAVRDPTFFITMPASYIEYLCQLAYEGEQIEGITGRSTKLAERIGATDLAKINEVGRGLIGTLSSHHHSNKAEPSVRKNMVREVILFHTSRLKRKEHPHAPRPPLGVRRPANKYLDDECFCISIPRKDIKNIVWDEETQTSRFRCNIFSDVVKVEGINLTKGHSWKHLRLQTIKTWLGEVVDWTIVPKSTRTLYIRDSRR